MSIIWMDDWEGVIVLSVRRSYDVTGDVERGVPPQIEGDIRVSVAYMMT